MATCLDAFAWRRYRRREPALASLIRDARKLKNAICAADPYEARDRRRLLNFGHTFGHVFESLTSFELSHGEAVCLGICCALDVGRELKITPESVAAEIERGFSELWLTVHPGTPPRAALAGVLDGVQRRDLARLLATDKKADNAGRLRMALVTALGHSGIFAVGDDVWAGLWQDRWRKGVA
jgi:3-dehydroquinate synthase